MKSSSKRLLPLRHRDEVVGSTAEPDPELEAAWERLHEAEKRIRILEFEIAVQLHGRGNHAGD